MEYTVLVKYKQWVDSGHPQIDDTVEIRSKIIKVKDLLELNDLFREITSVDVFYEAPCLKSLDKTQEIINELEDQCDALGKEYMTMKNQNSADYFLTLGKASQLGETIDFIKSKYE